MATKTEIEAEVFIDEVSTCSRGMSHLRQIESTMHSTGRYFRGFLNARVCSTYFFFVLCLVVFFLLFVFVFHFKFFCFFYSLLSIFSVLFHCLFFDNLDDVFG